MNKKLTDKDPMPFGQHKGTAMADVPDAYLLWLWNENKCNNEVREYIKDNLDAIKANVHRSKK
jgi:uncharacterized protein (DUF3820 family)